MRHRKAPYIAALAALAALALASPADARTMTVRTERGAPQITFDIPAGWRATRDGHAVVLERGRTVEALFVCPLYRETRDMTGNSIAGSYGAPKRATGLYGESDGVYIAVRGGGCVYLGGDPLALALAPKLHPRLGPATPTPPSNAAAEQLARAARDRTMAAGRVQGMGSVQPYGIKQLITMDFEWDLAARYIHYRAHYGALEAEVVRNADGNFVRDDPPTCWGETGGAKSDDTFEPRLELSETDTPPTTTRAWRVSYAPPEPQPDGTTIVRWTGFVSNGFAVIGADGLLRRVHVDDNGEAIGHRTRWRTTDIAFTAFPAAITPVRPEPQCPLGDA